MRHRLTRTFAAWAGALTFLLITGPPGMAFAEADDDSLPLVIKTKPTFVTDVLAQSPNQVVCAIDEDDIVRIEVTPCGDARGFVYFDSAQIWRTEFGLSRPEDFDNDGETRRWKLIGGMSLADKRAEFAPTAEGGAPLGQLGTGLLELKIWHHVGDEVSCTLVPVRVGMKKLYVEVDWFEGTFRKRVERRGSTQTISCKPMLDKRFIDAFGQCGIEPIICDSPETGNLHNVISADVLFDGRRRFNCENLSSLVPRSLRDETDARAFNEGTSIIARWLIDHDYVDLDPSRPDTVYIIGVQRWAKKGPALTRTMGVVCLLEYQGRRMPMAFVFARSVAESTAAVNAKQKTQISFRVAARHTAIHEIAAHSFPVEWNNTRATEMADPYWSTWRYLYAGHPRKPEAQDDYFHIYETCVTCAESGMDGAYYAFMGAPRLNDFRWRMANHVEEKTRDIIRDFTVDGTVPSYGYGVAPAPRTLIVNSREK